MSASEKLKALKKYGRSMGTFPHYSIASTGQGDPIPADNMVAWERYRDALPQIIAVVEAAEIARAATWQPHSKSYWEIEQLLNEIRDSADTALAALDERLGDVT